MDKKRKCFIGGVEMSSDDPRRKKRAKKNRHHHYSKTTESVINYNKHSCPEYPLSFGLTESHFTASRLHTQAHKHAYNHQHMNPHNELSLNCMTHHHATTSVTKQDAQARKADIELGLFETDAITRNNFQMQNNTDADEPNAADTDLQAETVAFDGLNVEQYGFYEEINGDTYLTPLQQAIEESEYPEYKLSDSDLLMHEQLLITDEYVYQIEANDWIVFHLFDTWSCDKNCVDFNNRKYASNLNTDKTPLCIHAMLCHLIADCDNPTNVSIRSCG